MSANDTNMTLHTPAFWWNKSYKLFAFLFATNTHQLKPDRMWFQVTLYDILDAQKKMTKRDLTFTAIRGELVHAIFNSRDTNIQLMNGENLSEPESNQEVTNVRNDTITKHPIYFNDFFRDVGIAFLHYKASEIIQIQYNQCPIVRLLFLTNESAGNKQEYQPMRTFMSSLCDSFGLTKRNMQMSIISNQIGKPVTMFSLDVERMQDVDQKRLIARLNSHEFSKLQLGAKLQFTFMGVSDLIFDESTESIRDSVCKPKALPQPSPQTHPLTQKRQHKPAASTTQHRASHVKESLFL